MEFSRTSENATLPDERMAETIEEKPPLEPGEGKTGLSELIHSLNCKLDELALVNDRLLELTNPSEKKEPEGEEAKSNGSSPKTIPPDELTEPVLTYRIASLLDFLRRWYEFEDCGVFLLNPQNDALKKLVSSAAPAGEWNLQEFEEEVKTRWGRGDFNQAIGQKRRMVLPAERGGSLFIIPFWILKDKAGLWVSHFQDTSLPEKRISAELSFWVELISFCIENSHLKTSSLFPQQENTFHIETEKLLTTAEISRAAVHEMNNYLQVILGRTQLLRINEKKNQKTPPDKSVLEIIEKNTNRVCSILKDFSDHLRRQFNRTVDRGEVNIRHLLESNFEFLKYILKSKKIELKIELEDEIPSVYGSPGEIELAFLSLILGLRNQIPSGGNIHLQASTGENSLCLNICCVPEETRGGKLSKLEDPYTNPRLDMVSRILKKQQGELRFEKFGEDQIFVSLILPLIPNRKADSESLQGLELQSPESCIQAEDSLG